MLRKRIRVLPATVALLLLVGSGLTATGVDGAGSATPTSPSTVPTTPAAIKALVAACPMPVGVVIPRGSQYFGAWGLGGPSVWLDGFSLPPASLRHQYPMPYSGYLGVGFAGLTAHGWFIRALWVIAGGWTKPVTLSGARVGGGASLWFEFEGEPATTVVLDPAHPGIPVQHDDYREWPSYLYFPETGCYELHAQWSGGGWTARIPFVAPARRSHTPMAMATPASESTP